MDSVIRVKNLSKKYRLGTIGAGTLKGDIQSWWAKIRGQEDPNSKVSQKSSIKNGEFLALNNISFEVNQGDALGIIGSNGAGKSTLLKILSRITAPTRGTIYIDGRLSSLLEVGTGFHPELTGRENVYLNGTILGMSKKEIDRRFDEIVYFSEVEKFIDTPVKRYSSGMYVKLGFSVAAHLDVQVLIVDEVLAVGDIRFQQKCLNKMGDAADQGKTVLYVSHNMNSVKQLCNKAILLDQGKILYTGDTDKAIDIYIDNKFDNKLLSYDFSLVNRFEFLSKKVLIQKLEFVNIKNLSINTNSTVDAKIEVECYIKCNIYIRISIRSIDGIKIGAMSTEIPLLLDAQKTAIAILKLNLKNLVKGKYVGIITLYEINDAGIQSLVDIIEEAFSFEVIETSHLVPNIDWTASKLGFVALSPIDMEIL